MEQKELNSKEKKILEGILAAKGNPAEEDDVSITMRWSYFALDYVLIKEFI